MDLQIHRRVEADAQTLCDTDAVHALEQAEHHQWCAATAIPDRISITKEDD
jgi:hypothetical protein